MKEIRVREWTCSDMSVGMGAAYVGCFSPNLRIAKVDVFGKGDGVRCER